MKMRDYHKW